MGKKVQIDKHHLIPKCRDGRNVDENIRIMDRKKHEALHILNGNRLPHALFEYLLELYRPCLSEEFYYSLREVLFQYKGRYYKNHCFRNGQDWNAK